MILTRPGLESRCMHSELSEITCKVCKLGKIYQSVFELKRVGDKDWGWSEAYYHCNTCGVKYDFLPKEVLEEPKPYQVFPGCYSPPSSPYIRESISKNTEIGSQIAESVKK